MKVRRQRLRSNSNKKMPYKSYVQKKKISFEEELYSKMLPFTFDLMPDDLQYIDRKCFVKQFSNLERWMLESILLGIDTETKPYLMKDKRHNPTSLIQIAVRTAEYKEFVFIIDLLSISEDRACFEKLDEVLTHAFLSDKVVKIGQGLDQDLKEMSQAYPSSQAFRQMNRCLETNAILRVIKPEIIQLASLKYMVKEYLNCNLVKTQQLSDWSARPLSSPQIHYAACDALVLLRLYDAMLCEIEEKMYYSGHGSKEIDEQEEDLEDLEDLIDQSSTSTVSTVSTVSTISTAEEKTIVDISAPGAGEGDKSIVSTQSNFDITSLEVTLDTPVEKVPRKRKGTTATNEPRPTTVNLNESVFSYTKGWNSSCAKELARKKLCTSGESMTSAELLDLEHIPLPCSEGKHVFFTS